MRKRYTYGYTKTVTGKITVTANTDEEARDEIHEILEQTAEEEEVDTIEVDLDFKDVEPDGPDRSDEDL